MIKSINDVSIHEIDGKERGIKDLLETGKLHVVSHRTWDHFIILQHGDTGETITVNGKDLITAVNNAMNVNRRSYG